MSPRPRTVRVVVVQDSRAQRERFVRVLEADSDIRVVEQVGRADEALPVVKREQPDVVAVDLALSDGGSLRAIEQIMGFAPTPILVVSEADDDSGTAVDALVAGALEAVPRPHRWSATTEDQLRRRVRALAGATVLRHPRGRRAEGVDRDAARSTGLAVPIVAIAASTGGPPALADLLGKLSGLRAAVLVVQHLHADFMDGFVQWMARVSALPVQSAAHGTPLQRGGVYIAPADKHLRLGRDRKLQLSDDPRSLHRPSADVLFESVALNAGRQAVGVLLTGMGDDGARGLLALRAGGGTTIAQDEGTSAVYGMPRAAVLLDAAAQVLPLADIGPAIVQAVRRMPA